MATPVRLYWHGGGSGVANFGDELSPLVVEAASGRPAVFARRQNAQLIAIGSILEGVLKRGWRRRLALDFTPIHVWGSGFVDAGPEVSSPLFRFALIRGPRSRARVDPSETLAMGDPGLIACDLLPAPPETRHRWGVIPHQSHSACPEIDRIVGRTRGAVRIDMTGDPVAILTTIASCERVLSSSLHGLIAADSFGIPNHRVKLSPPLRGDDWKFVDYFESVGREAVFHASSDVGEDLDAYFGETVGDVAYQAAIDARKADIRGSFPALP